MSAYRVFKLSKVNPILFFALLIVMIVAFIMLLRGIFSVLALLTPVMLIAALILNYRVMTGYAKWMWVTIKTNPLFGILAVVFTVVAFPLVAAYLLLKAVNSRGNAPTKKQLPGEYIPYQEVDEDFLDLSEVTNKKKDIEDKYNDLIK